MRRFILFALIIVSSFSQSFAWGPEGHAIVGRLAMRFVNEDVRKNVLSLLGNMSIDTAANWMDIMKSNQDYDFMRPWHYVDFAKGHVYPENNRENIVNRLTITYNELGHKKTLCSDQIRTDLLVLLHLMGDLHMPLHAGYDDDLGGNKRIVQYDSIKTHNLHTFWDEDIIRLTKITDEDCYKYYRQNLLQVDKDIDFLSWMKESRSLLDQVYDFPGFILDDAYLSKNKLVVEKQLLKAGLRLAMVLNKLFSSPAATIDFKEVIARYKNGIDVVDASKNIGKKVTVCSRVVGIKSSATITQISLGEKFPNSPLTIVIFSKSYIKFALPLEEMLKDKNICIKGTIETYNGRAQIIVENPEDISIL